MNPRPSNETVLVTGASSGLGLGIAEAYRKRGANVVLNARNAERLQAVADRLARPTQTALVAGDIALGEVRQRLVNAALERFGRVDVLVNNAGTFSSKPLASYGEEELDQYLSYLKATFLLTQSAVRPMREQGGGAIVNITTILTFRGVRGVPSSAPIAAKGGVHALTKNLAIELAQDNIRVNAVAPGIIKTPIHGLKDDEFDRLAGMQPLGRVGEVQDIVDAVLYLADANFVTGVVLPVDGGVAAGGE